MANQLFTDGDVHEVNGQTLECVGASYRETDGEKHDFVYQFRLKSEVDAEREAEAKRQEALEAAQEGVETPAEEVSEPVNNQPEEETQYVK